MRVLQGKLHVMHANRRKGRGTPDGLGSAREGETGLTSAFFFSFAVDGGFPTVLARSPWSVIY